MFFFQVWDVYCVTILDCNYRYSEWKHCSWHFYSSSLFQTCCIVIVTYLLYSKTTQTSLFLTQYNIYLNIFYTLCSTIINSTFFRLTSKNLFLLQSWKFNLWCTWQLVLCRSIPTCFKQINETETSFYTVGRFQCQER